MKIDLSTCIEGQTIITRDRRVGKFSRKLKSDLKYPYVVVIDSVNRTYTKDGKYDEDGSPFDVAEILPINKMDIKNRFPASFTVESKGNPELKRLISKMLKEAGWEDSPFNYCEGRPTDAEYHASAHLGRIGGDNNKSNHFSFQDFVAIYHGFKEYEKLIQLPKINGYDGRYDKENNLIIYGCAEMSVDLIINLNKCITTTCGNRHVTSFKLDSEVEISADQIKAIVEYLEEYECK